MTILDKSGSTSGKNSTPLPIREYKNCILIKIKMAVKITINIILILEKYNTVN